MKPNPVHLGIARRALCIFVAMALASTIATAVDVRDVGAAQASAHDAIDPYEPPRAEGEFGSETVSLRLDDSDWWRPPVDSFEVRAGSLGLTDAPEVRIEPYLRTFELSADERAALSPFGVAVEVDTTPRNSASGAADLRPGGYDIEVALDPSLTSGTNGLVHRLRLVRFDGCATDGVELSGMGCASVTPLESEVDLERNVITATFENEVSEVVPQAGRLDDQKSVGSDSEDSRGAFVEGSSEKLGEKETRSDSLTLSGGGSTFVALAAAAAGPTGDYSATPIESLSEYQVSPYTGSLSASYDIPTPPGAAGPQAAVSLIYSSGSIDGLSADTNTQGGPVGLGWTLGVGGNISRQLKQCDGDVGRGNKCLFGDGKDVDEERFTIALNGISSTLVRLEGNEYRLKDDPMWRVFFYSDANPSPDESASHGRARGEWWEVVTPDGTRWQFGLDANTARYVPVWYPADAERPCDRGNGLCDTAYKWDLERVVDTSGNVMTFEYIQEFNHYNPGGLVGADSLRYVRAASIRRVEYGASEAGALANARVEFNWEPRCGGWGAPENDCAFTQDNYPDVPVEQWCPLSSSPCAANLSPTFWTQLRLGSVATQLRKRGAEGPSGEWVTDSMHDLVHYFPDPVDDDDGDENPAKLALLRVRERPITADERTYEHYGFSPILAVSPDESVGDLASVTTSGDIGFDEALTVGGGDTVTYRDIWTGDAEVKATEFAFRYANGGGDGSMKVSVDGVDVATVPLPSTAGWSTFETLSTEVDLPGGVSTVDLRFEGPAELAHFTWFKFDVERERFAELPGLPPVTYAGDGAQDEWEWLPNRLNAPDGVPDMKMPRVKRIENELGGIGEFEYGQSHPCESNVVYDYSDHQLDCYGAPSGTNDGGPVAWHKWKVEATTTIPGSDQPPMRQTMEYVSPPKWAYAPARFDESAEGCNQGSFFSDFRGHNIVRVIDAAGITEQRFFQGMDGDSSTCQGATVKDVSVATSTGRTFKDERILEGKAYESRRLTPEGVELERSITLFDEDTGSFAGDNERGIFATAGRGREAARFVAPWRVETTTAGTVDKTSATEMLYDQFGNVVEQSLLGDVEIDSDDRRVVLEYVVNEPSWILTTACRLRLFGRDGAVVSETRRGYGPSGSQMPQTACETPPNRGLVTNEWSAETESEFLLASTEFDDRGKPETSIDPNGNRSSVQTDPLHGWLVRDINPLGWGSEFIYNDLGQQQTIVDSNGGRVNQTFDAYGRLEAVHLQGARENQPSYEFSYVMDQRPVAVETRELFDASLSGDQAYLVNVSYLDGIGRDIQRQARGQASDTRWITTQSYDEAGRLHRSSAQFEQDGEPDLAKAGSYFSVEWSTMPMFDEYEYDAKGATTRLRSIGNAPGEESTDWQSLISYDGWTTSAFDMAVDRGTRTDFRYDAFGNLVEVTEFDTDEQPYGTMRHTYDAANRLVSTSDANGNETTATYDQLGRRRSIVDPSSGEWLSEYDANGNMVLQRDARGVWVGFAYDELDRLVRRFGSDEAGAERDLQAEWQYDDDSVGRDRLFRSVSYQRAGTVEKKHVTYDELGRLTELQTLVDTDQVAAFRQLFGYGAGGQQTTLVYPGDAKLATGEVVSTRYDSRTGLPVGLDSSARGTLVDDTTYGPDGMRRERSYGAGGNDATETWEVDQRTQRTSKYQAGIEESRSNVISHEYKYDVKGNTTSVSDGMNDNQTLCYAYDEYSRLVHGFTGGEDCKAVDLVKGDDPYDEYYEYSNIHNLVSKTGVGSLTYGEDGAGPSAVTSTSSGTSYRYDANGNQIERLFNDRSESITFDENNRVSQIAPTGEPNLSGGQFLLRNKMTGRFLTKTDSDNVTQSIEHNPDSLWRFEESDIGGYRIVHQSTGLELNSEGPSARYNVDIVAQGDLWDVIREEEGDIRLLNQDYDRVLDADKIRENYNVDLSPNRETDGVWELIRKDENIKADPFGFDGSSVSLINAESKGFVGVVGDSLEVVPESGSKGKWRFERLSDGYYHVISEANGEYLDGDGPGQRYGVDTSDVPRSDDRWEVQDFGDGDFRLYNVAMRRYLNEVDREGSGVLNLAPNRTKSSLWHVVTTDQNDSFPGDENGTVRGSGSLGTPETYIYGADGDLAIRANGSDLIMYVGRSFEWHVNGDSGSKISHYYLAGNRVAVEQGDTYSLVFSDHLGSAAATVDGQGSIEFGRYLPWGETRGKPIGGERGFTGQRRSEVSNLLNYGARLYDPALGRFISADSMIPNFADPEAFNRFSYVYNNPATFVDPTGNWPQWIEDAGRTVKNAAKSTVDFLDKHKGTIIEVGAGIGCGLAVGVATGGAGALAAGAACGAGARALANVVEGRPITDGLVQAGLFGLAGGAIGKSLSKVAKPLVNPLKNAIGKSSSAVKSTASKALSKTIKKVSPVATKTLSRANKVVTSVTKKVRPKATLDPSAARAAGETSDVLLGSKQVQKKWKHAVAFGVDGNYNSANAARYSEALKQHINSTATTVIKGTYRDMQVMHHLDQNTGLNVIADLEGNYVSGWKLGEEQLKNVLRHGGLN